MPPSVSRCTIAIFSESSAMSSLALEIEQTMQQLDAVTASRLERLLRDALALVKSNTVHGEKNQSIRFPLVQGAKPITSEDALN
ncbi:MAG: hypothetical protein ACYC67_00630 [Prosthecobacter sp.]